MNHAAVGTRSLATLLESVPGARTMAGDVEDVRVTGVKTDASRIGRGDLFIAVPGVDADGHAFVGEAMRRGAAAVIVERPVDASRRPIVVVVDSARRALAAIAAAWFGRPADRLRLVGITGSLGKTSILMMLASILDGPDSPVGIVGSLGARLGERSERTRLTTPDARDLHRILAWMADAGADRVIMEATSHALEQDRVHGLTYELGVFTNIVPLEHGEYHGSFREYVDSKRTFLDRLQPGAPVIYGAGNRAVRAVVEEHVATRRSCAVGCGAGNEADVRVRHRILDDGDTRISLEVRRPLPAAGGGRTVAPVAFDIHTSLLGRPNVTNAAIAGAAALCLGAGVDRVRTALEAFKAPRRRMELIQRAPFTVLDDTVGHPESLTAVFEVARRLSRGRLHVVYAIRGGRGEEINRRDAEAIAIWSRRVRTDSLTVTASVDATEEPNRVESPERRAFVETLEAYDVEYRFHETLEGAIATALDRVDEGDLLLLLGAQGMNAGAETLDRLAEGRHGPVGEGRAERTA